jgi:hypothetical protein
MTEECYYELPRSSTLLNPTAEGDAWKTKISYIAIMKLNFWKNVDKAIKIEVSLILILLGISAIVYIIRGVLSLL